MLNYECGWLIKQLDFIFFHILSSAVPPLRYQYCQVTEFVLIVFFIQLNYLGNKFLVLVPVIEETNQYVDYSLICYIGIVSIPIHQNMNIFIHRFKL